jgi:hypothetical protein
MYFNHYMNMSNCLPLSCGVVPDSAGPLLLFRQKPASACKEEHGRAGGNPEFKTTNSLPYASTGRDRDSETIFGAVSLI